MNLKNVGMCYVKYDQNIVAKHKVELVGWPASVKFANPSEISNVDDIRKLHHALNIGECKWIVQSQGQQAAYAEKITRKVAAGELVVKKRKQRSDKGKPRGLKVGKNTAGRAARGPEKTQGMGNLEIAKRTVKMTAVKSPGSHRRRNRKSMWQPRHTSRRSYHPLQRANRLSSTLTMTLTMMSRCCYTFYSLLCICAC